MQALLPLCGLLLLQDPAADPLAAPVLVQAGRSYSAREVLDALGRYDATLPAAVARDPEYRRLYLRSPRFLEQVHQFSNGLLVQAAGIAPAQRPALLAEAAAWGADHGSPLPPESILAGHGLEIEWRAALLALQPADYGTQKLRDHMLSSVPEFFCDLRVSAIRVPLVSVEDGSALPADERRRRYDFLDDLARRLQDGALSWDQAWEETETRYGSSGGDPHRKGALGLVRRSETRRFEEPFLRQVFQGLGFLRPEQPVLRGPITGELWVYLARVESVLERGVVELERVRPQVDRSLREQELQAKLAALASQTERQFLAPLLLPE